MEFQKRFLPIPAQSFFLFGPWDTGKSTWLRHLLPEALFVDLLQPDGYRERRGGVDLLAGRALYHTIRGT